MDGLDITRDGPSATSAGYRRTSSKHPRRQKRRGHLHYFLLAVILPTLTVAGYFFFFAANQYVSEAKFVVRGPNTQSPGMLSSLLQTAGVARAPDDTYAVQDYIVSRDALGELVKAEGLHDVFSRPEADPLSRFPLLLRGQTFEHFYDYFQKHVDVLLDTNTGVSTLTVRTFRADDSHRIATALLNSAERLVNRMNDRQRENAMRDARKEVILAEDRVQSIAAQVADFRNRMALLDPNKQSVPMLQSINDMQNMQTRADLQIAQLRMSSPHSPLIADYERRTAALRSQITEAKTKITGTESSLVPKITAYDRLMLQREFADRQLASATTSLETARMQAERQQLYLDPIVQPNTADWPAYPKRFASIAISFATLCGIYLMAALLISGAREHRFV